MLQDQPVGKALVLRKYLADSSELERWYVGVSLILGMGIPIIPGALGHFGWDPILNVW